jgi:hypothetical protein
MASEHTFKWPEQSFAEEVARAQDGRSILFRVTPEVMMATDGWSEPVCFRFVSRVDGTYEMELMYANS